MLALTGRGEVDEQAAIGKLIAGDPGGLEPLVRAYQVRAVRTAYLITQDRAGAEDIVQEAFLRAFERIAQLRPGNPFGPWFLRIVTNDALKAAMRRQKWAAPPDHTALDLLAMRPDPQPGPEDALVADEQGQQLRTALAGLSPEQRAVVVLRYYLELGEAEIAEWVGVPRGTVKWRLHQARRTLREILRPSAASDASHADRRRLP